MVAVVSSIEQLGEQSHIHIESSSLGIGSALHERMEHKGISRFIKVRRAHGCTWIGHKAAATQPCHKNRCDELARPTSWHAAAARSTLPPCCRKCSPGTGQQHTYGTHALRHNVGPRPSAGTEHADRSEPTNSVSSRAVFLGEKYLHSIDILG